MAVRSRPWVLALPVARVRSAVLILSSFQILYGLEGIVNASSSAYAIRMADISCKACKGGIYSTVLIGEGQEDSDRMKLERCCSFKMTLHLRRPMRHMQLSIDPPSKQGNKANSAHCHNKIFGASLHPSKLQVVHRLHVMAGCSMLNRDGILASPVLPFHKLNDWLLHRLGTSG